MNKIGVLGTWDGILLGHFVQALLDAGVGIDCILLDSKPTSPRDFSIHEERTRGALPPISLHEFASAHIPCFPVEDHNGRVAVDIVCERGLDILVNGGTPRILRTEMLTAPSLGVVNCHPGLLPSYRGASCVEWALFNGDPVGNSIHLMSAGIDEGKLLRTAAVPVPQNASYTSIRIAVYRAGFRLMAEACLSLQAGTVTECSFVEQGAGHYFKPIDADSMKIVLARYPEARPA